MLRLETLYNPDDIIFVDLDEISPDKCNIVTKLSENDIDTIERRANAKAVTYANHPGMYMYPAKLRNSIERKLKETTTDTMKTLFGHHALSHEPAVIRKLRCLVQMKYMASETAHTIIIRSHTSNWTLKFRDARKIRRKKINFAKMIADAIRVNTIPQTVYCIPASFSYSPTEEHLVNFENDLDVCYAVLIMTPEAMQTYAENIAEVWNSASDAAQRQFIGSKQFDSMFFKPGKKANVYKHAGEQYTKSPSVDRSTFGMISAGDLLTTDKLTRFVRELNKDKRCHCIIKYRHCGCNSNANFIHEVMWDTFSIVPGDKGILDMLKLEAPTGKMFIDPEPIEKVLFKAPRKNMRFVIICNSGKEYTDLIRAYVSFIVNISSMSPNDYAKAVFGDPCHFE